MKGEISRRTEACQDAFVVCLSDPSLTTLEWIENRQGDFNLWASSLKATSSGGRSSLDYRVRDRPDVKGVICELLDGLLESVEQLVTIAESGRSLGTDTVHLTPAQHDTTTANSDSSGYGSDSGSLVSDGEAENPFSEQKENIQTILNELARISMAIRKSGSKYRYQKADASLREEEFDDFKNHLTVLILLASGDAQSYANQDPETRFSSERLTSVQKRLIHANMIRRNRIQYATRQMRRIQDLQAEAVARAPQTNLKAPRASSPELSPIEVAPQKSAALKAVSVAPTQSIKSLSSLAPTATEIGSEFNLQTVVAKKTPSIMTRVTQTGAVQDYPRCPRPTKDGMLQCPYCADVLPAEYSKNEPRWRGHVAQDLLPYSCIFDNCSSSDEMFLTSDELAKHMQKEHSTPCWTCDYCSTSTFADPAEWESHMTQTHAHSFPANQLRILSKMSRRMMLPEMACPLCAFSVDEASLGINEHITQHLHEFALKALPWTTRNQDGSSSRKSGAQPSTDSHLDDLDSLDDDYIWDGRLSEIPFDDWLAAGVQAQANMVASEDASLLGAAILNLSDIRGRLVLVNLSSEIETERWATSLRKISILWNQLLRRLEREEAVYRDELRLINENLLAEKEFLQNGTGDESTSVRGQSSPCPDEQPDPQRQRLRELESKLVFISAPDWSWAGSLTESILYEEPVAKMWLARPDRLDRWDRWDRWDSCRLFLLENYLVISDVVADKNGNEKYYVTEEPIDVSLLFIERFQTMRPFPTLAKLRSRDLMGTLDPEIQTLYPFRITHAGKTVYELGALSAQARTELFEKTGEMKRRHSKTQPFSFELRACSQVSIDPSGPTINGVPVALDDPMPRIFEAPIGDANCLTIVGGRILLMGTDHGVLSVVMVELRMGTREIRKWVSKLPKVTQMAALEDLDLLIVLANGSLFTYPLQSLLDGEKEAKSRRLAKEVLFFAVATLSDRRVLLYAKKEGPNTALHVLEQKRVGSSANKDGFFSRLSRTRTTAQDLGWEFREIDAFVMLNGCNSINIFRKHIALGTKHGFFEVLTLDRNPTRIPDLQGHDLRDLASRIKDLATVSMFWLDGNEFILVYQNCAVYVDKHGDVSRSAIMEFISQTKPVKAATMFDKYLILFTDEYVEIRDTEDGRLRQVIAGKGIKCLDYGIRGPTGDFHVAGEAAYSSSFGRAGPSTRFRKATVKFSMFLLEQPDQAVVLELVLDPEMAGASKHPPRDDLGETTEDLSSHADATAAPVSSRPGRGEGGDSPGREEQLGSTSLGLQPFTTLETFPTTTLGPFPTSHRRNAISVPHDEWNRYASPEPEGSDSETY